MLGAVRPTSSSSSARSNGKTMAGSGCWPSTRTATAACRGWSSSRPPSQGRHATRGKCRLRRRLPLSLRSPRCSATVLISLRRRSVRKPRKTLAMPPQRSLGSRAMTPTETPEQRFSGPRLRIARLFRGLTQADLGGRASITPQFVGHLEHGLKQPGEVVTEALADILGVQRTFFYGLPLEEFRDEECHFRRRATTPVSVRSRVLAHGSLFGELVAFLDNAVSMPEERVPPLSIQAPEEAERAAELSRMTWGLGRDLPIKNLTRAVETAGVVVTRFAADTVKVDAFSRSGRRSVVVLNSDLESNVRSRFDLAHELAHLIGHGGTTTGDAETEKQANRFAGAFLLPRAGFVREFSRSRTGDFVDWPALFKLKQRWRTSVSAMVRRAYELRLISAVGYQAA